MFAIFLIWIAGNIPNKVDVEWAKRGGGLVGHDHPPAYRFNAGQKMIYWIVVIGGTAVAVTGYLLMFPFYATDIQGMQLAQTVHAIIAVLFVAAMLAHIYIGTIGMEGAFEAMGEGTVDVNWAQASTTGSGWSRRWRAPARMNRSVSRWRRRPNRLGEKMKSFVAACVAAIVIATIAGFVLNTVQKPTDEAYSTTGVRL